MKFFSYPEHDAVYTIISQYFGNPLVEKTKQTDVYSMYVIEIASMLLNEKRFLIVFVTGDHRPVGTKEYVSNLKWTSLQTRTIPVGSIEEPIFMETRTLPPHAYLVQRGEASAIHLLCDSRTKELTRYHAKDVPIEVALLHTKQNEYEYPHEGNLASALETFQTILQFK